MKKRNGFTLIELLGVLVVLGVVAIIVFPSVTGMIKNSKQKSYEQQKNIITSAARKWGLDNTDSLNEVRNVYVSLDDLIKGGYLTNKDVKDPRNDEIMKACIVVSFSNNYNQYEYTLEENDCSVIQKKYLIDITNNTVTTGSGLYKMSDTEYRYRGGCNLTTTIPYTCSGVDPINNYVSINGQKYRIISIDSQGIKVMSEKKLATNMVFDTNSGTTRNNANNTFCQAPAGSYYGCSVYAAVNGNFTAGNKIGTVTQNSTLYDYLNTKGTDAEVKNLRDRAISATWNIGAVTDSSNAPLSTITHQEQAATAKFKLGLINTSDYIYGSLDAACQTDPLTGSNNSHACRNNNWLFDGTSSSPWTLNPYTTTVGNSYSIWHIYTSGGRLNYDITVYYSSGVRPVGYLSSATTISGGNGTASNPYVIE